MTLSEQLPPLANLFLVRSPDPKYVADVAHAMRRHRIHRVHSEPGWVVGLTNLPGRTSGMFQHPASGRVAWFTEGEPSSQVDAFALIDAACDAPRSLRHFDGDFSLIVIDGDRTVVVRSGGGLVPCLVSASPHQMVDRASGQAAAQLVVSTRMVWFGQLLPSPPNRDLFAHVVSTDGVTLPDRRTPWSGVTAVRSGRVEHLQPGSRQSFEYWNPVWGTPRRSGGKSAVHDAAVELRRLVVESLSTQLDPDGRNLFGLSGGVDSSCLAALAVRAAGRSLMSLTMDNASDPALSAANAAYVEQISNLVRPTRRFSFRLDAASQVLHGASGRSLGMPIAHPSLIELPKLADQTPIITFTGGELADDLFAGPYALWHDWLNNVTPVGLLRSLNAPLRPIRRRGLVRLWALASIRRHSGLLSGRTARTATSGLAGEFRKDLREEFLEWEHRTLPQFDVTSVRYGYLQASREFDGWLLQNWEACSDLGIRRVTPFVTRQMYDLACSVTPGDHALPPKRLMRYAFDRDLPHELLWRSDKGGVTPTEEESVAVRITPRVEEVLSLEALDRLKSAKQQDQLVVPAGLGYSLALLGVSLETVAQG